MINMQAIESYIHPIIYAITGCVGFFLGLKSSMVKLESRLDKLQTNSENFEKLLLQQDKRLDRLEDKLEFLAKNMQALMDMQFKTQQSVMELRYEISSLKDNNRLMDRYHDNATPKKRK